MPKVLSVCLFQTGHSWLNVSPTSNVIAADFPSQSVGRCA